MEAIVGEPINPNELMKFERKYKSEEALGKIDKTTSFEYSWCLVRSKYKDDWYKGLHILKELYNRGDTHEKRDYIFYMAVAHYKLKEYEQALKLCDGILHVEPGNYQVKELKDHINKTMKKEGMIGMAAIAGTGLVLGVGVAALVAVGLMKK